MSDRILDHPAREALVHIAHATLAAAVRHEPGPASDLLEELMRAHPALGQSAGAFVTIYVAGHLRGCLGEIEPEDSLVQVIVRCARKAPLYDYRFEAVLPSELLELSFKISILSAPEPLDTIEQIEIGRHGLIARHEGRSALLLPDVPVEYGWDLPTFLEYLWKKAGIDRSVPVSAVSLWAFTTEILSSADFPVKPALLNDCKFNNLLPSQTGNFYEDKP